MRNSANADPAKTDAETGLATTRYVDLAHFVTLTVRLKSGLVGFDRTDQMAADGAANFKALSAADNAGAANLP